MCSCLYLPPRPHTSFIFLPLRLDVPARCGYNRCRCDILAEADPPVCQHCKQYSFECTFFLPITETRFKKKKVEEEAAAAKEKEKDKAERSTSSPLTEHPKSGDIRVYGKRASSRLTPLTG